MCRRIISNCIVFVSVFFILSFLLSNVCIKGRPIWGYLNSSIVLKGGQAFNMLVELNRLVPDSSMYLILGSSHAYRGYDPEIFKSEKIKVFNAGTSGQSLESSFALLKQYANLTSKVIFDIYPGSFVKPTEESQLTIIQNSPKFDLAAKFLVISPNIHSVNNFLYRILRLNNNPIIFTDEYIGKGYVSSAESLGATYIPAPASDYDIGQFKQLIDIIQYAQEHSFTLDLVSHPLPHPSRPYPGYYVFKSLIDSICRQYRVNFFDYTYRHELDNTYFKDINHLNEKGVKYFNRRFIADRFVN